MREVQLSDELYERARELSEDREVSVDELVRQGLEMLFERPWEFLSSPNGEWHLPRLHGAWLLVPLEDLHRISFETREAELLESLR